MLDSEHEVTSLFQLNGKRHIHTSCIKDSKFSDHPHIAALGKEGNLVSLIDSQSHKPCRYPIGLESCLLKSGLSPAVSRFFAKEDMRSELSRVFLYEIDNCRFCCHIVILLTGGLSSAGDLFT